MTDHLKGLEIRYVVRKLRDLDGLPKNARFMKAHQFKQLVANIQRDGVLTSAPLIYRETILSGNHRCKAALEAGIEEVMTIEILTDIGPVDGPRARAIALSHNSISGQDDVSLLAEQYAMLPLDEKLYSGITDDMLKVEEVDISSLTAGQTQYQSIEIIFLPEDAQAFITTLERIEKKAGKVYMLAPDHRFDDFFNSIIAVKNKKNVFNSGLALRAMMELALDRLLQESDDGSEASLPGA